MYPTRTELASYLEAALSAPARVVDLAILGGGEPDDGKAYGYGRPLFVKAHIRGEERRFVLETMRPGANAHEHRSDRAAQAIWAYDTFGELPRHVAALDVGAFRRGGGTPLSLGQTDEYFYLAEFVDGEEYAHDLARMRGSNAATAQDRTRADALCDYLAGIHERRPDVDDGMAGQLYRRRIRDLVGHGECIMGVIDTYPTTVSDMPKDLLRRVEQRAVDWRWKLRSRTHRLRQVHGDFHPWNILFGQADSFFVLDRSRGEWGEPADDVTCLSLNYLFFALQAAGNARQALMELYTNLWKRYLATTKDGEMLEVAPPFAAFRALVMAHPLWYPDLTPAVRQSLFRLADRLLDSERFDPELTLALCEP